MDGTEVLAALRSELIDAALVRRPTEGNNGQGSPYPFAIEPPDGPPAPGELHDAFGDDTVEHTELVVSAFLAGEFAPASGYDAATRRPFAIDLRYRSKNTAALRAAMDLDAAIRARLVRPETNFGYGWLLGGAAGIWVLATLPSSGFSPLGRSRAGGYDHVAKWIIETTP